MINFYQFLESKNNGFYHGSKFVFPAGFKLLPSKTGYVNQLENQKIEAIMERYRPKNKLSRFGSVFLVNDPDLIDSSGGYTDHIYIVQPARRLEKSDLSWYSDVSVYGEDEDSEEVKQAAINYWKGIPYKNQENSLFEYRTPYATIIKEI